MRILHLITRLGLGGAEAQLLALATAMREQGHEIRVVTLIPGGENAARLRNAGIQLDDLGMRRGLPTPWAIFRLLRLLREWRPDVLQSWLYHADLVATVASTFHRVPVLLWNLRCSVLEPRDHSRMLFMIIHLLARWSGIPDCIIANSSAGRDFHEQMGYSPRCWQVIPNAIDTLKYKPSEQARHEVREELGLPDGALLIALVARFHPMKDHECFLRAAAPLMADHAGLNIVLVGPDIEPENSMLTGLLQKAGLQDRVHLLGSRTDMPRLQAAWDIAVSASYSEGFSNTIAEAMACGVPCVSTTVGDAELLLGDTGRLVPPRDPAAMHNALKELLQLSGEQRKTLAAAARQRICAGFTVHKVVERYLTTYRRLLQQAGDNPA